MNEHMSPIPSRLYNAAVGGHVAGADQIIDDKTGLTLDKVAGGALEEKTYTSGYDNGMGRLVLRKNLVNGVNTLVQTMLNKSNTIYIIQYDFTLGEDITVPDKCILKFEGGSVSGAYTLTGNNTKIKNISNSPIFDSVEILGVWCVNYISDSWFKTADKKSLISLFAINNSECQTVIEINKTYNVEFDTENQHIALLTVLSNTELILNGDINVNALNNHIYHIIDVYNSSNVYIHGSGSIIGDRDLKPQSVVGEQGHGIQIGGSTNVIIEGINISKCFGDGILIGGYHNINTLDNCSYNIIIRNCNISYCRRQGISLIYCDTALIENNFIHHIYGTNPQACIDVENANGTTVNNITITNNKLEDSFGYIIQCVGANDVNVINNYCKKSDVNISTDRGYVLIYNSSSININNNFFRTESNIIYYDAIYLQGNNTNIKLSQNEIKQLGIRADSSCAMIRDVVKTKNLTIENNIFYDVDVAKTMWKGFIINNSENVVFANNNTKDIVATYPDPTIVSDVSELIDVFVQKTQALLHGKPIWWNGTEWVDATGTPV